MAESKLEKLKIEATKLGIPFSDDIAEADLKTLVADKKAAELEERTKIQAAKKKAEEDAKKTVIILKNVFGEDVDPDDYFFKGKNSKGEIVGGVPSYFNRIVGFPVDREDLIVEFNRIFKPELNFLFYKQRDKELYLIIVPLKHAHTIGGPNESMPGDFQKHAISFITEGSVNVESLRMKLSRVFSTIKIND